MKVDFAQNSFAKLSRVQTVNTVLKPQNQIRISSGASAFPLVLLKHTINDFSYAFFHFSEKYAQVQQNPILPPASLFLWCKNSEEVSAPSFACSSTWARDLWVEVDFHLFLLNVSHSSLHALSQGPPLCQWHAAGEEGDGARLREDHQPGQRVPDHQLIGQRQARRAGEGGGHGDACRGKDRVDVSGPGNGSVSHSMPPPVAHAESLC